MYLFICLLMAFMWYLTKKIYICKILYLKDMNVWLQGLTILVLKILQLWLLNFCVGPWKRLSSASVCVFVSHKSCPRSYLVHAIPMFLHLKVAAHFLNCQTNWPKSIAEMVRSRGRESFIWQVQAQNSRRRPKGNGSVIVNAIASMGFGGS